MIKILLILAYLLCDYSTVSGRVEALGPSVALAEFVALYLLFAGSLFLAGFIRSPYLRIPLAAALAIASVFQQSFVWTTQGPLTYEAFLDMMSATGQTSEALAQHGKVLMEAIPVALLLFLGIALPPRKRWVHPRLALAAPLVALGLLSSMLYARGGEGSSALPAAYPPLSFAGFMAAEDLVENSYTRGPVTLPRSSAPVKRDVVLLVDESIAGNYLDIDNPLGVPTGLKDPPAKVRLYNYGYATSVYNCSAESNFVLRYGGTRQTYLETTRTGPSIWAYAHKAGMRTVYIDAQGNNGHLQNDMTPAERAQIDDFIQFDGVPVRDRDMRIEQILAQRINNSTPDFIYVNKVGAHFPIQDKYPDSMMRYKPVLPRGETNPLTSWTSDRSDFDGTPADWVLYRNSYRDTLLWNVGEFFRRLFAQADMDKATIVYTSDHGQDLHERGNPGKNTHCGGALVEPEEALVPLMVIEGAGHAPALDWSMTLAAHHNGLSHYRIFPTLLALMGYDSKAADPLYGPPMTDPAGDDFSTNVVFTNYLGRKPAFRHIDLGSIVSPPTTDSAALAANP